MYTIKEIFIKLSGDAHFTRKSLFNKPFKQFINDVEVANYIFRASGDVYISIAGEVNTGFYDFNESDKKLTIEYQNQLSEYSILYMDEKIVVCEMGNEPLIYFTNQIELNHIESYFQILVSSKVEKPTDEINVQQDSDVVTNSNSRKSPFNKSLVFGVLGILVVLGMAYYFVFPQKSDTQEIDIDAHEYKMSVSNLFSFINSGQNDSILSLFSDTINIKGVEVVRNLNSSTSFLNYFNASLQAVKFSTDTVSYIVITDTISNQVKISGSVLQVVTDPISYIPFLIKNTFECRFSDQRKINFLRLSVLEREIDYGAISGLPEGVQLLVDDRTAINFFNRNFGRLSDTSFSLEYKQALTAAITKFAGSNVIINNYLEPSNSFRLSDFLNNLMAQTYLVKEVNSVVISNGIVSELSVTVESIENLENENSISNSSATERSYFDENSKFVYKTDCYMIVFGASSTIDDALIQIKNANDMGYANAGYLWIPDFPSLSGKKNYAVVIGPYDSYDECLQNLKTMPKGRKYWYGKKISMESIRQEEIRVPE